MRIIGKADIPSTGIGKVKSGQTVNIKLDNYPYMEFGMIKAKIKNISLVPITVCGLLLFVLTSITAKLHRNFKIFFRNIKIFFQ